MKAHNPFINILKNGCVIFTVITLLIYAVGTILSNSEKSFIPTFYWILLFFIFSMLLSGVTQIMHIKKIKLPIRFLLHFLAAAVLYIVSVVLCGGFYKNGTMLLLSLLLFIIGYVLFAILYSIGIRRQSRNVEKKEAYKSVFH